MWPLRPRDTNDQTPTDLGHEAMAAFVDDIFDVMERMVRAQRALAHAMVGAGAGQSIQVALLERIARDRTAADPDGREQPAGEATAPGGGGGDAPVTGGLEGAGAAAAEGGTGDGDRVPDTGSPRVAAADLGGAGAQDADAGTGRQRAGTGHDDAGVGTAGGDRTGDAADAAVVGGPADADESADVDESDDGGPATGDSPADDDGPADDRRAGADDAGAGAGDRAGEIGSDARDGDADEAGDHTGGDEDLDAIDELAVRATAGGQDREPDGTVDVDGTGDDGDRGAAGEDDDTGDAIDDDDTGDAIEGQADEDEDDDIGDDTSGEPGDHTDEIDDELDSDAGDETDGDEDDGTDEPGDQDDRAGRDEDDRDEDDRADEDYRADEEAAADVAAVDGTDDGAGRTGPGAEDVTADDPDDEIPDTTGAVRDTDTGGPRATGARRGSAGTSRPRRRTGKRPAPDGAAGAGEGDEARSVTPPAASRRSATGRASVPRAPGARRRTPDPAATPPRRSSETSDLSGTPRRRRGER